MLQKWKLQTFGKKRMFFVLGISLYFFRNIAFFMSGLCQTLARRDRYSTFNTSDMPLKRKQYNRFAVGQYTKAKKNLQEEFAREKASLSQLSKEVKTLQRKVQRLDDKVNKLRMTASI